MTRDWDYPRPPGMAPAPLFREPIVDETYERDLSEVRRVVREVARNPVPRRNSELLIDLQRVVREIARNPVPRRNSELLIDLQRIASAIIPSPYLAFGYREKLTELRDEITAAVKRPIEDVRTINYVAIMMANCLLLAADESKASRWIAIAKAFQPWIAEDAGRAVELELKQSSRSGQ